MLQQLSLLFTFFTSQLTFEIPTSGKLFSTMAGTILKAIESMIRNNEETANQLMQIKEEIQVHHFGCNIAKTTGTSVS